MHLQQQGFSSIATLRRGRRTGRVSSWDPTGKNSDNRSIRPGESCVLADLQGPGQITHMWFAQPFQYREVLLRITYDNARFPSVLCPIGDFFCLGNGIVNSFQSALFTASSNNNYAMAYDPATGAHTQPGCGFNCYVPMPYRERALVELVNEGSEAQRTWYYVDFERFDNALPPDTGYFHAEFRRNNPFQGWGPDMTINAPESDIPNKAEFAWKHNYVILETQGRGQYIGCNLSVANLCGGWWGEGDDMIWVDGYKWPPELHGTGSEDYFNHAWGMQQNAFLRNGSSIHEGPGKGYQTSYVFHLENPVYFEREIKVTIEAGHGNHLANDYSSVAYWYAETPTAAVAVPPVAQRVPVFRDAYGVWLHDPTSQCPGPQVVLTPEVLAEAPEVADALNPRQLEIWRIPRLPEGLALENVDAALAEVEPRFATVPQTDAALAEVRMGVSGDHLVLLAHVRDAGIKRDPYEYWLASAFEVFGAVDPKGRTTQIIFLPPEGNQYPSDMFFARQGNKMPADERVRWSCTLSGDGYTIRALIPCDCFAIDAASGTFVVETAVTARNAEGQFLRAALVTSAAGGWQSARRFQPVSVC